MHVYEIFRFKEINSFSTRHIDLLSKTVATTLSSHRMEVIFMCISVLAEFKVIIGSHKWVFVLSVELLNKFWVEFSAFLE